VKPEFLKEGSAARIHSMATQDSGEENFRLDTETIRRQHTQAIQEKACAPPSPAGSKLELYKNETSSPAAFIDGKKPAMDSGMSFSRLPETSSAASRRRFAAAIPTPLIGKSCPSQWKRPGVLARTRCARSN